MTTGDRGRVAETVKQAADILEVAGDYAEMRRAGREYVGLCPYPDHDERTPSFYVSQEKGVYICRGACGRGGDAIRLVRDLEGVGFDEAVERLAERFGVRLERDEPAAFVRSHRVKVETLGEMREKKRGGQRKAARVKRLGETARYAVRDAAGEVVAEHVRVEYLLDDGTRDKDMFWRSGGRKGLGGLKLVSLPLYGTHLVADWPPDATIVVCEGETPTEALWRAGIRAVGTVTGASSCPGPEALESLRDRRVVIWMDDDPGGREHARELASALRGIALEVRVFRQPVEGVPKGADAANHPAAVRAAAERRVRHESGEAR